MLKPNSLSLIARRRAQGRDVSAGAIRVALLSRRYASRAVRVEALDAEPLPSEWAALGPAYWPLATATLGRVLERITARYPGMPRFGVMAVPDAAVVCGKLGVDPAACGHPVEALVRDAAERGTAQAGETLALDWRWPPDAREVSPEPRYAESVASCELAWAAVAQPEVDARIEAAAAVGVSLLAIDCEPAAALRAMRYRALEVGTGEPYYALWLGEDGMYGWHVEQDAVVARVRYPAPEYASLDDAVRRLVCRGDPAGDGGARAAPRLAWLAGDPGRLEPAGLAPCDLADLLGCTLTNFSCDVSRPPAANGVLPTYHAAPRREVPEFAVAVGLALRGVLG